MVVKKKKALKHGRNRYGKSEFFPYTVRRFGKDSTSLDLY